MNYGRLPFTSGLLLPYASRLSAALAKCSGVVIRFLRDMSTALAKRTGDPVSASMPSACDIYLHLERVHRVCTRHDRSSEHTCRNKHNIYAPAANTHR